MLRIFEAQFRKKVKNIEPKEKFYNSYKKKSVKLEVLSAWKPHYRVCWLIWTTNALFFIVKIAKIK